MKTKDMYWLGIALLLTTSSCEKFLSERNTSAVSNISSLKDMQALLDATNRINNGGYCALLEMATDDFFLGTNGFHNAQELDRSMYIWEDNYSYELGDESVHWRAPYQIVAIANTILDELVYVKDEGGISRDHVKGSALFHRAFAYSNLVQVYCTAYDPATADRELGLPMRLDSDINYPSKRVSLEETFRVIENDIRQAIEFLPVKSDVKTRPNKVAAYGLLARLYLLMQNYPEAMNCARIGLELSEGNYVVMDFNRLDPSMPYPISPMNDETIYFAFADGANFISQSPFVESYVDTTLYSSYHTNDLRKAVFFQEEGNGYFTFKGSYFGQGGGACFIGITLSELLLIKAESSVRTGHVTESLDAINLLMANRYNEETFQPINTNDRIELLRLIVEERRKELLFRGARWSDLKRFNQDSQFAKTLLRKVGDSGFVYELPPGDLRYVFLIPQGVIEKTGIQQNPR